MFSLRPNGLLIRPQPRNVLLTRRVVDVRLNFSEVLRLQPPQTLVRVSDVLGYGPHGARTVRSVQSLQPRLIHFVVVAHECPNFATRVANRRPNTRMRMAWGLHSAQQFCVPNSWKRIVSTFVYLVCILCRACRTSEHASF